MDDYDPACPTEDDIMPELDLSQVPLPPSAPGTRSSSRKSSRSSTPVISQKEEPIAERKSKRKKKKKKKGRRANDHEDSEQEYDAEDPTSTTEKESQETDEQSGHDGQLSREPPSLDHPSPERDSTQDSSQEPPVLALQPSIPQQTTTRSSTPTPPPPAAPLQFKLKTDPGSGKSKVSFQLRKTLRQNPLMSAEDDDDEDNEGENEEKKPESEEDKEKGKKMSEEYVPTRFKGSKKHMFRPDLLPSINLTLGSLDGNGTNSDVPNILSLSLPKPLDAVEETNAYTNISSSEQEASVAKDSKNSGHVVGDSISIEKETKKAVEGEADKDNKESKDSKEESVKSKDGKEESSSSREDRRSDRHWRRKDEEERRDKDSKKEKEREVDRRSEERDREHDGDSRRSYSSSWRRRDDREDSSRYRKERVRDRRSEDRDTEDRRRRDRSPDPRSDRRDRSPDPRSDRRDRSPDPRSDRRDRSPDPRSDRRDRSPDPRSDRRDRSPDPRSDRRDRSPDPRSDRRDRSPDPRSDRRDRSPDPRSDRRDRSPDPRSDRSSRKAEERRYDQKRRYDRDKEEEENQRKKDDPKDERSRRSERKRDASREKEDAENDKDKKGDSLEKEDSESKRNKESRRRMEDDVTRSSDRRTRRGHERSRSRSGSRERKKNQSPENSVSTKSKSNDDNELDTKDKEPDVQTGPPTLEKISDPMSPEKKESDKEKFDKAEKLREEKSEKHIKKIVIRRSTESNDFEIAKDGKEDRNRSTSPERVNSKKKHSKHKKTKRSSLDNDKDEESEQVGEGTQDKNETETLTASKASSNSSKDESSSKKDKFSKREKSEGEKGDFQKGEQTDVPIKGPEKSKWDDTEDNQKDGDAEPVEDLKSKPYYNPNLEPALPPDQVLVDISALPGKSKWEMEEEEEGSGMFQSRGMWKRSRFHGQAETMPPHVKAYPSEIVQKSSAPLSEMDRTTRPTVAEVSVSGKIPLASELESSNEEETEHPKKGKEKKKKNKNKAEKKSKKKKKKQEGPKEGDTSSSGDVAKSEKSVSQEESSSKEKKDSKSVAKSEGGKEGSVNTSKIVDYLKGYSEIMAADSEQKLKEQNEKKMHKDLNADDKSAKESLKEADTAKELHAEKSKPVEKEIVNQVTLSESEKTPPDVEKREEETVSAKEMEKEVEKSKTKDFNKEEKPKDSVHKEIKKKKRGKDRSPSQERIESTDSTSSGLSQKKHEPKARSRSRSSERKHKSLSRSPESKPRSDSADRGIRSRRRSRSAEKKKTKSVSSSPEAKSRSQSLEKKSLSKRKSRSPEKRRHQSLSESPDGKSRSQSSESKGKSKRHASRSPSLEEETAQNKSRSRAETPDKSAAAKTRGKSRSLSSEGSAKGEIDKSRSGSAERKTEEKSRSVSSERKGKARRDKSRSLSSESSAKGKNVKSRSQSTERKTKDKSRSVSSERKGKARRDKSRSLSSESSAKGKNVKSRSQSTERKTKDKSRSVSSERKGKARRNKSRSLSSERRARNRRGKSRSTSPSDRRNRRKRSRSLSLDRKYRNKRKRSRSMSSERRRRDRRRRSVSRSQSRSPVRFAYRRNYSPDYWRNRRGRNRRDRSESLDRWGRRRRRSDSRDRSGKGRRQRSTSSERNKRKDLSPVSKNKKRESRESSVEVIEPAKQGPVEVIDIDHGDGMPSIDLASIPVPGEIPLPGEIAVKSEPAQEEAKDEDKEKDKKEQSSDTQNIAETGKPVTTEEDKDNYEDTPMDLSEEEMEEEDSKKDDEKSATESCVPNAADSLSKPAGLKAQPEPQSFAGNKSTLSSGKDRQIKFSIMGGSKRLKPAVLKSVLDDEDEVEEGREKMRSPTLFLPHVASPVSRSVKHEALKAVDESVDAKKLSSDQVDASFAEASTSESMAQPKISAGVDQKEALVTDDAQIRQESVKSSDSDKPFIEEDSSPEIPLKKAKASMDLTALTETESPAVKETEEDDEDDDPYLSSKPKIIKKPLSPTPPQRLKFTYTPLWALEDENKKPQSLIEEEKKLKEKKSSLSLGLDYGSESSDLEEEGSSKSSPKKKSTALLDVPKFDISSKEIEKVDEKKDVESKQEIDEIEMNIKEKGDQSDVCDIQLKDVKEKFEVDTTIFEDFGTKETKEKSDTEVADDTVASKTEEKSTKEKQKEEAKSKKEEDLLQPYSPSQVEDDYYDDDDDDVAYSPSHPSISETDLVSGATGKAPTTSDTASVTSSAKTSSVTLPGTTSLTQQPAVSPFLFQLPSLSQSQQPSLSLAQGVLPPIAPASSSIFPAGFPSLLSQSIPMPVPPPNATGSTLPPLPVGPPSGLPMPLGVPAPVAPPQGLVAPPQGISAPLRGIPTPLGAPPGISAPITASQGRLPVLTGALQGIPIPQGAPSGVSAPQAVPAPQGLPMPSAVLGTSAPVQNPTALYDASLKSGITASMYPLTSAVSQPVDTGSQLGQSVTSQQNIPVDSSSLSTSDTKSEASEIERGHAKPSKSSSSKRPRFSSILSQPKIEDPKIVESLNLKPDKSNAASDANLRGDSKQDVKETESKTEITDVKEEMGGNVKKDEELSHTSKLYKEGGLQQSALYSDSIDMFATSATSEKKPEKKQNATSVDAILMKSETDKASESSEKTLDIKDSSAIAASDFEPFILDMDSIPLPGAPPIKSSKDHKIPKDASEPPKSDAAESVKDKNSSSEPSEIQPPASAGQKTQRHLVESFPHRPPPTQQPTPSPSTSNSTTAAESDPASMVSDPKSQTLGALLAEKKRRFLQSPLAIGLPKISIQSPLSIGPLPMFPPEPSSSTSKLKTQIPKPVTTPEKVQSQSRIHIVLKAKPTMQKTVVPGFEDDASDEETSQHPDSNTEALPPRPMPCDEETIPPPPPSPPRGLDLAVATSEGSVSSTNNTPTQDEPMSNVEYPISVTDPEAKQKHMASSLPEIDPFPDQSSKKDSQKTTSSEFSDYSSEKNRQKDDDRGRDRRYRDDRDRPRDRDRDRERDKDKRRDREDDRRRDRDDERRRDRDDDREKRRRDETDSRKKRSYNEDETEKVDDRERQSKRKEEESWTEKTIKKEKDDDYAYDKKSRKDEDKTKEEEMDKRGESSRRADDQDSRRRRDDDRSRDKRRSSRDRDTEDSYRREKEEDRKRKKYDDEAKGRGRNRDWSRERGSRDVSRERDRKRGDSRDRSRRRDDSRERDRKRDGSRERKREDSRERYRKRDDSRERGRRDRSRSRDRGSRLAASSKITKRNRSRSMSPDDRWSRERPEKSGRWERSRSRSDSRSPDRDRKGRSSGSSSRRKESKSFKEELLEEFEKLDSKSSSKTDLYSVTGRGDGGHYTPEDRQNYPPDAAYPSNSGAYPPLHPSASTESMGYSGQDPAYLNQGASYPGHGPPPPSTYYDPSQYDPTAAPQHTSWPGQETPGYPTSSEYPYGHPQATYGSQPIVSASQPYGHPPVQAGQDPYFPVPPDTMAHQPPYSQQPPPYHQQASQFPPQHIPGQFGQPGGNFQNLASIPPVPSTYGQQRFPIPPAVKSNLASPNLMRAPRTPLLKTPLISVPTTLTSPSTDVTRQASPVVQPENKSQTRGPRKSRFSAIEDTVAPGSPLSKSVTSTSGSPSVDSSTMNKSDSRVLAAVPKTLTTTTASSSSTTAEEPSFETSSLAEPELDAASKSDSKQKAPKADKKKSKTSEEVNEQTVSSSGVEDSTGDTGSDSGTDTSQKPLKVKSRWRRNSEAEAVVDTSTPPQAPTPPMPLAKQLLNRTSAATPTAPVSSPSSSPTSDSSPKEMRRTRSRARAEGSGSSTDTPPPPPPPSKKLKLDEAAKEIFDDQTGDESTGDDKENEKEVVDMEALVQRPDFPKFEIITENIHLKERRRNKSMKRMQCDCTTSKEDRAMGLVACGADCLNRMLMIECGSRCPCGDYCTNKRFQKKQYSNAVPFTAGDKGWGLRAGEDLGEKGTFIMEYVGELLDYEEFVRRTRQYAKTGLRHHYFMALNADEVVDATLKGSISRFINHSCDPNCETQKWTVNGELRVGFFTRKEIKKGEELTFDYQFEHYGEAQKCYCGSANCRGQIGIVKGSPQKSPPRNNRKKDKKKKEEIFNDEMLEADIKNLSDLEGLQNRDHVLELCRLMVRAEKAQHRMAILQILQDTTETACLKLFLDYHGLSLFWSWMTDIGTSDHSKDSEELKIMILSVLKSLPVPNKNILKESKVLAVVERWALAAVAAARKPPPPPPTISAATTTTSTSSSESSESLEAMDLAESEAEKQAEDSGSIEADSASDPLAATAEEETLTASMPHQPPIIISDPNSNSVTPVSILASVKDGKKTKRRVTFAENEIESAFSPEPLEEDEGDEDGNNESGISSTQEEGDGDAKSGEEATSSPADSTSQKDNEEDNDELSATVAYVSKNPLAVLAAELLAQWSHLKEVFKIPKKERVEERKRTERELDVLSKKEPTSGPSDPFAKWKNTRVRTYRRRSTEDEEKKSSQPKMSKEERRQLFEAQVKAEDELVAQAYAEEQQRQQEAFMLHQQRLMEDPNYFYLYQQQQELVAAAGGDPNLIPPEALLMDPALLAGGQPEVVIDQATGQPVIDPATGQPMLQHPQPVVDPATGQPLIPSHHFDPNSQHVDPITGQVVAYDPHQIDPATGQPVQHIDPHTGQPIPPQHIDPHTGQPILPHVDPLTGEPIPAHIDPHTGQPIDPHTGQPIPPHIDPHTGQPIPPPIDPLTGQPIPSHIDPHTGQPIAPHIDPHTGQPLPDMAEVDPVSGQAVPMPHLAQMAPGLTQQAPPASASTHHFHPPPQQKQQPPPQSTSKNSSGIPDLDLEEEVPPPPSPPTVPVVKLPPNWKTAKDSEGRVYYYHAFTRQTQWDMPSWEENEDDTDNDMDLDPMPNPEEVIRSKKKTMMAAADTSSEVARKIKEQFRSKMSGFIVTYLNPYRKQDCKAGRITSTEDFKHLARKLTHHVMSKELKHCRHVEDLEVNENVKAKAKDYVRKYMSKFGPQYEAKKISSPMDDTGM